MFQRRLLATGLFLLLLSGCGGGGSSAGGPGGSLPPSGGTGGGTGGSGASETVSAPITAAGGSIALPSGSSATIGGGVLSGTTTATLSTVATAPIVPANSAEYQSVGPAVVLTFASSTTSSHALAPRDVQPGDALDITLGSSYSALVDGGTLGFVHITFVGGKTLDLAQPLQMHSTDPIVLSVPKGVTSLGTISSAQGSLVKIIFKAVDNSQQPGLRYYDLHSHAWVTTQTIDPTAVHPLFVLHGIFSNVERTFPPAVMDRIVTDGAYDAVIGYDYNWFDLISNVAPAIGSAFASVPLKNTYQVDLLAHSYGTLMAIAALPAMGTGTGGFGFGFHVNNLMLVEGPLDGALISDPKYLASLLVTDTDLKVNLPSGFMGAGAALAQDFNNKYPDWVAQFQQGNPTIKAYESQISASDLFGGPDRIIKVAGTIAFPGQNDLYKAHAGHDPAPSDGVIDVASALSDNVGVGNAVSELPVGDVDRGTIKLLDGFTHTGYIKDNNLGALDKILSFEHFSLYSIPQPPQSPVANLVLASMMKGVGASGIFNSDVGADTVSIAQTQWSPKSGHLAYVTAPFPQPPGSPAINFWGFALQSSPSVTQAPLSAVGSAAPSDTISYTWRDSNDLLYYTQTVNYYLYPDCAACTGGVAPAQIVRAFKRAVRFGGVLPHAPKRGLPF